MNRELNQLLKETARSFYRTLAVLPAAVRPQISLAYLLARTTDTIADTELVSAQVRLEALDALRKRILDASPSQLNFGQLQQGCALPAEKILLERIEDALALLHQLPELDRELVQEVLRVIVSGQELDLRRFPGETPRGPIVALDTEADLDDYAYRVAGCVGEFWTRICRRHLFPDAPLDDAALLRDGVRFGKGLQYVNILRDLPRDLRKNRCYLPRPTLAAAGLTPEDLLAPAAMDRFRPLYNKWLDVAEAHLAAGWNYTNALPGGQARVRLACAWPILFGIGTLRELRRGNVLDEGKRIKISRGEVKSIMARSVLLYPFGGAWRGQFARLAHDQS